MQRTRNSGDRFVSGFRRYASLELGSGGFKAGSGVDTGKDPSKVIVPPHLPDHQVVRNDILDYSVEIEHFDQMVGRALDSLERTGESDNTIVVVTSDHGMPFPRAKASLYDAGTHVPLAIRWPDGIKSPGRASASFVSLSDLAPTFLVAAGLQPDARMIARSLMSELTKSRSWTEGAGEGIDHCERAGDHQGSD